MDGLPSGRFEKSNGLLGLGDGQRLAVNTPGDSVDGAQVSFAGQYPQTLPLADGPNIGVPQDIPAGKSLTIGGKGEAQHVGILPGDGGHLTPRGRVPQFDCVIAAVLASRLRSGEKTRSFVQLRWGADDLQLLAAAGVPHADRAVVTTGNHRAPIGRKSNGINFPGMVPKCQWAWIQQSLEIMPRKSARFAPGAPSSYSWSNVCT